MATLPISVPNTFQTQTGNIALSQLDNNFTTIYTAVNTIGNGITALSNVYITGGNATFTIANISSANLTNATIANVTVSNVTLNNGSLNNVVIGNVTTANGSFTYLSANGNIAPTVNIGAISYGNLSYTDNNNWQVMTANVNSYAQFVLQNKSSSNQASTDLVLSNDVGTATTYYVNLGINSSTFAGSGPNSNNAGYLTTTSSNLVLGTTTNNYIFIAPNNTQTAYFSNLYSVIQSPYFNVTSSVVTIGPYGASTPNVPLNIAFQVSNSGSYTLPTATITSPTDISSFNMLSSGRFTITAGANNANSASYPPVEVVAFNANVPSVSVVPSVTFFGGGTDGNTQFNVNSQYSRFNASDSHYLNFGVGAAGTKTYLYGTSSSLNLYANGNAGVQLDGNTVMINGAYTTNSSVDLYIGNQKGIALANIVLASSYQSYRATVSNANLAFTANVFVHTSNASNNATVSIINNTATSNIVLNLSNLTITSPGITTISSTGNVVIQGTNTTISANGTMTINANANISIIANSAIGLGNIASPATLLHIGNTSAQNVVVTITDNTANGTIGLYNANLQIKTANTSGYIIFANSTANTVSLSNTAQFLVVGAGGALGYGTGAGGNITQGTSKTTGVTLNTGAGTITMNNAALASNTSVTFLLTNSVIAAIDSLIVNVQSGAATVGSYTTQVSTLAAGSANITVRNITAGSLSEAVVLNFVVLKGATA